MAKSHFNSVEQTYWSSYNSYMRQSDELKNAFKTCAISTPCAPGMEFCINSCITKIVYSSWFEFRMRWCQKFWPRHAGHPRHPARRWDRLLLKGLLAHTLPHPALRPTKAPARPEDEIGYFWNGWPPIPLPHLALHPTKIPPQPEDEMGYFWNGWPPIPYPTSPFTQPKHRPSPRMR